MQVTMMLAALAALPNQFDGVKVNGRTAMTGFENLAPNGQDASNFNVGIASFTGGVAGTRRFPPGYHKGMFAFITNKQSTILFSNRRNRLHFFGKDIRELVPATRGMLVVTFANGTVQQIPLTARWRIYRFRNVARIDIRTNGVSNIDTFQVVSLP